MIFLNGGNRRLKTFSHLDYQTWLGCKDTTSMIIERVMIIDVNSMEFIVKTPENPTLFIKNPVITENRDANYFRTELE